jgi:GH25 family lysozyme M1 (1,4-beta-N-acetylmuramidase)
MSWAALASTLRRVVSMLRPLASTPRRRRNLAMVLIPLLTPVWAVGSVPRGAVSWAAPTVEIVPPGVLARIVGGRPDGYAVGGIDISSHDHGKFTVHWPTEVAAGSQFVYVKATEGTSYVNPHFASDYAAARAAGRYVGAYVYARPDRGDPVGQATFFLAHARFDKDDDHTLVPFVDLEWPYAGVQAGPCYDLTPDQMRAWISAFIGRIESTIGRKPMIYTNTNWWNPCTGNDPSYADYPLDIASYTKTQPKLPAGWTSFTLWQYTPGDPDQRSDHDRDVVANGMAGLKALAGPAIAHR